MTAIETMSEAWFWLHIVSFALATFALRAVLVVLFSYVQIPETMEENLELVPPAILAALAVPPFVYRDGVYHLSPTSPFILTGVAAAIAAWRTESLIVTIATGFAVFFAVTYLPVL